MNARRRQKTANRKSVETTVSAELNGVEKRFAFTHSRGGNFGISGGAAQGTFAVATTKEGVETWLDISDIYRSTSRMRTLNQFTATEMVSEQLR